jgi:hypothetical protein
MTGSLAHGRKSRWARMFRRLVWLLLALAGLIAILVCAFILYGLNFKESAMERVWEAGFQGGYLQLGSVLQAPTPRIPC